MPEAIAVSSIIILNLKAKKLFYEKFVQEDSIVAVPGAIAVSLLILFKLKAACPVSNKD